MSASELGHTIYGRGFQLIEQYYTTEFIFAFQEAEDAIHWRGSSISTILRLGLPTVGSYKMQLVGVSNRSRRVVASS
jgi:hypothetical protein